MIIVNIFAGGYDESDKFDTILEYDFSEDSYTQIGSMTQTRREHAVTVIQYEDFSEWCV